MRTTWILAGVLSFIALREAEAVLVYGPQGRNTTAPTDPGQNAAWEFEGAWQNNSLGTPIAPNYFLTSSHVGGQIGDSFTYQGANYTTTAEFTDPNSPDLRIWQVGGTFSSYAPLYNTNDELNQSLITFGLSGARGDAYSFEGTQRGWAFTLPDGLKSWGTNQVDQVATFDASPTQYLAFQFNSSRGPNTASLAPGDSGGGVFVEQGGVWKLAGVNYAVDGPYYTSPPSDPNHAGSYFSGAIFDQRGLFVGDDATTPVLDQGSQVPALSYASRLSSEFGWIYSVTAVPEPSSFALMIGGFACVLISRWNRARR